MVYYFEMHNFFHNLFEDTKLYIITDEYKSYLCMKYQVSIFSH